MVRKPNFSVTKGFLEFSKISSCVMHSMVAFMQKPKRLKYNLGSCLVPLHYLSTLNT